MTRKFQQLNALRELTELKSEMSRAKLSTHRAEIDGIAAVMRKVTAARATIVAETPTQAAADDRYAIWAAKRNEVLQADLAMAMARAQPVKEMAAKDEGRSQVIKQLIKDRKKRP